MDKMIGLFIGILLMTVTAATQADEYDTFLSGWGGGWASSGGIGISYNSTVGERHANADSQNGSGVIIDTNDWGEIEIDIFAFSLQSADASNSAKDGAMAGSVTNSDAMVSFNGGNYWAEWDGGS